MNRRTEKAKAGMLAGIDAGHAQALIDRRLAADAARGRAVALLDLDAIRNREADTRPPRAAHVLSLAESIAAVGLVQPLAVDYRHILVAGLHRLVALRLLAADGIEARALRLAELEGAPRMDMAETRARLLALPELASLPEPLASRLVPCRVLDMDAEADPEGALAAEAAENTARKNYTPTEVAAVADRLRMAGFRDSPGRPRAGERALRPALALVLGLDLATIRRHLNQPKPAQVCGFPEAAGTLIRSLDAFDRALADVAALDMTRAQRNARKDAAALGAALRRLTTRQKP